MIFGIHGFFNKGFLNDHAIHLNVIVKFLHPQWFTCHVGSGTRRRAHVAIATAVHVPGHINARGLQQIVHFASIL